MITRRQILSAGAVAAIALPTLKPNTARASTIPAVGPSTVARASESDRRVVTLRQMHTLEEASFRVEEPAQLSDKDLQRFNHFMRDHHDGKIGHMDPMLIIHLYSLQQILEVPQTHFEVLSAFRSTRTNRALRRHSKKVAVKSMHLKGQAIDIRLPGVKVSDLRQAAIDLKAGGVGYYRRSGFVHFDTGDVRYW